MSDPLEPGPKEWTFTSENLRTLADLGVVLVIGRADAVRWVLTGEAPPEPPPEAP